MSLRYITDKSGHYTLTPAIPNASDHYLRQPRFAVAAPIDYNQYDHIILENFSSLTITGTGANLTIATPGGTQSAYGIFYEVYLYHVPATPEVKLTLSSNLSGVSPGNGRATATPTTHFTLAGQLHPLSGSIRPEIPSLAHPPVGPPPDWNQPTTTFPAPYYRYRLRISLSISPDFSHWQPDPSGTSSTPYYHPATATLAITLQ